ncbi:MAG: YbjN domain-containing protein [Anaerolineae bacterium]|nr:YbjN domain-containing protein [Anaerolineae bacterium]
MSITAETIEGYFEQYGWSYDQLSETDFRTGFRGDVSIFRIIVHIADSWVYFSISPFVVAPQDPECERRLYKHLLHLNHEINMAKFTIDQDGDVILTVELPSENLDYSEFSGALGALSYYADDNYAQVFILAQVPQAHSLYEEKQDLDWEAG